MALMYSRRAKVLVFFSAMFPFIALAIIMYILHFTRVAEKEEED
jgi:hypothetical protein